jgi:hypothetical protein
MEIYHQLVFLHGNIHHVREKKAIRTGYHGDAAKPIQKVTEDPKAPADLVIFQRDDRKAPSLQCAELVFDEWRSQCGLNRVPKSELVHTYSIPSYGHVMGYDWVTHMDIIRYIYIYMYIFNYSYVLNFSKISDIQ